VPFKFLIVNYKHNKYKTMDLKKRIDRSFSISKALGKVGIYVIGAGAVLLLGGYAMSFHVEKLESKLRTK
jgi:hypothetical protein